MENKIEHSYVEIDDNGNIIPPKLQENEVLDSTLRLATEEEKKEVLEYYVENGKCKFHLVHDEPGFPYDKRICDVCGKFIGNI